MTDLATLGIVIDSSTVPKATGELDQLAAAGTRAEATAATVGATSKSASAQVAELARQTQLSAGHMGGLTSASNNARIAQMEMMHAVRGSVDSFAAGAPVTQIFAQHISMVAQAASFAGESLGKVGGFLAGPWGIAVTAAVAVAATFIGKLHEAKNAVSEAIDKLREHAQQTRDNETADRVWSQTLEGLLENSDKLTESLDKRIKSQRELQQLELASINSSQLSAESQLTQITKDLAEAKARLREFAGIYHLDVGEMVAGTADLGSGDVALGLQRLVDNVKSLSQRYNEATIAAGRFSDAAGGEQILLARDRAKALADPLVAIHDQYERLRREAEVTIKSVDVLTKRLADLDRQESAAITAATNPIEKFKQAIIAAEGLGKNPLSSASGFGQFLKGTWLQEFDKIYPQFKNLTDQAKLAMRENKNVAEGIIDAYARENAKFLEGFGATVTAANLYLAHVLGPAGAQRVLQASPNTPVNQAVSQAALNANPFMVKTGTVGGLLAEIARRIGDDSAATTAGVEAIQKKIDKEADDLRKAAEHFELLKTMLADVSPDLLSGGKPVNNGTDNITALGPQVDILAGPKQMLDLLQQIAAQAQTTGQALSSAFGNVGNVFGGMISNLADYRMQQQQLAIDVLQGSKTQAQADSQLADLRHRNISSALAGLKSLFKEHSTGYKVMSAIEKAYAAFQAVQTAIAIARDIAHTVSSVANSTVRTTANTAEGGSKLFAQLGVWAFPVVAAMVAVIAALGFKGGKGGGGSAPTTADAVQSAQGTGTVLGSANAQSESIAHSLDLTAANTNKMLEYDNQQLRSLRAIETNIGVLATQVAKELQVGGAFDLTGKTGSSSNSGFLGLFGSTTNKSLFDQGLQFNPTMLADAIANGISGSTYQIIEKVKTSSGFLGIGGGTKTSYTTTTGALDPALQQQVGLILGSLRDSVVQAAKVLGFDVQAALNTFQVEIGKISFTDMSADEIQKALEAVFSKVADQMAGFAVSGLEQFQKAGEGLFETLQRLAKDYTTIDVALKSIGKTFGSVGSASIAARESLIALFGSLENFVDETAFYQQNFLTDAQAIAPIQAQVKSTLASLGLSSVDTIAKFNQVVQGIDLTTTAGQQLYASLMALAPAFYQVEQYQEQQAQAAAALAKQKAQLEITLLQAQGKAVEALAAQRKMELAALDPSLRALQQQIYTAQDIASAKDKLSQAYARERDELQATINKFGDLSKSLRAYRDTLFGGAAGGLTYNQALANLIKTGSLAAAGDATALGDLPGVGKSFLDIAKDSAGSLQQYQRDVALVARYVDQGITAADGQVSVAQKQLDTMTAQVGTLIDINTSVLSVKQAIIDLQKLMGGTGTGSTPTTPTTPQAPRTPRWRPIADDGGFGGFGDLLGGIHDRLDDIRSATMATAGNTRTSAKIQKSWDRGGSQAISTDSDTPLATTAS